MNDRFKFRAWHKPTKYMIDVYAIGTDYVFNNTYDGVYTKYCPAKIEDCILMQCTSLKDKNGKLIYEGDLLRYPKEKEFHKGLICEVFWHDNDSCQQHIGFQMNRFHFTGYTYPVNWGTIYDFIPKNTEKMEIIGNIYENPELLEV